MTRNDYRSTDARAHAAERRALAATFRLAVRFDLHESIDNHFSLAVEPGRFLINPYGIHWSRLRAGDLLAVEADGRVVEGQGEVEATALHIHAAVHRRHSGARCVLHTHMPFATAIACTEGSRLQPISQTAAIFDGQIANDDDYGGLGDNPGEGDRPLKVLPKDVVENTAAGWAGMTDHANRHFNALVEVLDAKQPDYADL